MSRCELGREDPILFLPNPEPHRATRDMRLDSNTRLSYLRYGSARAGRWYFMHLMPAYQIWYLTKEI